MTTYGQYLKKKLVSYLTIIFAFACFMAWKTGPEEQPTARLVALILAIVFLLLNPICYWLLRREERKEK